MPRWRTTGTGPGKIIGQADLAFHAHPEDNAIRSCAFEWNGEAELVPFLPGVAFDQYFPNLREVVRADGYVLLGEAAQEDVLAGFEGWVQKARDALGDDDPLPSFASIPLDDLGADETVAVTATSVVRLNDEHERLWSETDYSSSKAEQLLFGLIYTIVWDWIVASTIRGTQARMIDALERQFAHYAANGIPSDFRMRDIGKAPFAAAQALPVTPQDYVQETLDRATVLCATDMNEQTEVGIAGGPPAILGVEAWEGLDTGAKEGALSISRMGFAVRLAELELYEEASDRNYPGWLPVGDTLSTMVDRHREDDPAVATIAAADFFTAEPATVEILFASVPGLSAEIRGEIVDAWVALCERTGLSSSTTGMHQQPRIFIYGFALAAMREFALVAQERGDAERQGRPPTV